MTAKQAEQIDEHLFEINRLEVLLIKARGTILEQKKIENGLRHILIKLKEENQKLKEIILDPPCGDVWCNDKFFKFKKKDATQYDRRTGRDRRKK